MWTDFGWLNDPLLLEVQKLLDLLAAKTGMVVNWSSAVPGATTNWTSIADTRRRKTRDTLKTGKNNVKQVAQYVRYMNMSEVWSCISPTSSQIPDEYVEGKEYPACALFQNHWTADQAEKAGYSRPFVTPYANRIEGSNADMFGRPVTTAKVQVFISDIYRSAYFIHTKDVNDLFDLKLKRYQLQSKDLANSTVNPENHQYYGNGPNGLSNLTAASNAPVWVSNPHFLDCDDSLIASFDGLNPNPAIHRTYLDIEPQTGQLARAMKALQENWRMESLSLPTIDSSVQGEIDSICVNVSSILVSLNKTNSSHCNLTAVNLVLESLSQPSEWNYAGGVLYFPLAYVREATEMSESDANELIESLYGTENFTSDLQLWSFIIAGTSFILLVMLHFTVYRKEDSQRERFRKSVDDPTTNSALDPLLAVTGYN